MASHQRKRRARSRSQPETGEVAAAGGEASRRALPEARPITNTLRELTARTDLQDGAYGVAVETGRGGHFKHLGPSNPDLEAYRVDDGNVFRAGTGGKLARVLFLVAPSKQEITRFEHYPGDLSALPKAERLARQEANFWALQRAIHAAFTGKDSRGIVEVSDYFEYRIPTDGSATPPADYHGIAHASITVPALFTPRDSRYTFLGGGKLKCTNWLDDGPFVALDIGSASSVTVQDLELEGPDYCATYDTFEIGAAPESAVLTSAEGRFQPFHAGARVYIQYNRANPRTHMGGTTVTRTVARVASDGSRATLDQALPPDVNGQLHHRTGVVLHPDDYAAHLDAYGRDWGGGPASHGIRYLNRDYGTNTYHKGRLELHRLTLSGKFYAGVEVSRGYTETEIEGGSWTAQAEALVAFNDPGIRYASIHARDLTIHDAAFIPAGFRDRYRSERLGHSFYIHPNINVRFTNYKSIGSKGTPGKLYSGKAIKEGAEYAEFTHCLFRDSGEPFMGSTYGRTTVTSSRFENTAIHGGQYLDLIDCEVEGRCSFGFYAGQEASIPHRIRVSGGKVDIQGRITVPPTFTDAAYLFEGLPLLRLSRPEGYAKVFIALGGAGEGKTLEFIDIPRLEIVDVSLFGIMGGGKIAFRKVNLFGVPAFYWMRIDGPGPELDMVDVVQVDQRRPFLEWQTGEVREKTLRVRGSAIKVDAFPTQQLITFMPGRDAAKVGAAATLPLSQTGFNRYVVSGRATIQWIPKQFTGEIWLRLAGAALGSEGNIAPASTRARTGWVRLVHDPKTGIWKEV